MARYPGVTRIAPGLYRVRAKWRCPKTGHVRALVRIVEAESAAEAASKRETLKLEERKALEPLPRLRVGDCAKTWLRTKHGVVKASTAKHYVDVLETHVLPKLGDIWLDMLTREDIVAWRDGQTVGAVTANGRLRVLKNMLADVCSEHRIANPADRVPCLREAGGDEDETTKVLTAAELRALLDAVRTGSPQWYPLALMLATTGARFGEVTALTWTDINEEAGTIRIRRAQWHGIIDTTKTETVRSVPLAPELVSVLAEHRARLQKRVGVGPLPKWIFPTEKWTLPRNTVLIKPLKKAAEAAKLGKRPSNHWFRHTMSDLLRQATTDQVQRAITGHVTPEMAEHYSHVAIDEKKVAHARVLRLVGVGGGVGASSKKRKAG
jgi:integrase